MWQFLTVPILCLLPGSWIAFASTRGDWDRWSRAAVAVALSPIVVVLEYYLIRTCGLSFERAVMLISLINIPSLLLIFRALRSDSTSRQRASKAAVFGVLIVCLGCMALAWFIDPIFRKLSWHGLMHTDVCYAIARGALVPEEPELAGVRLAYPWFGHIYWTVMAWSGGVSPTQIYMVTGLVWAVATGVLCYATCRRLGGAPTLALACPVLAALGTNLLGLVGWSVVSPNANPLYWAVFGDLRYAPFVQKYISFEAMPFGLTLFAAMILATVDIMRRKDYFQMALIPLMLAATGGLYPNVFPAAFVLALSAPLVLLAFPSLAPATYGRRHLILQLVLILVAFGIGFGLIKFFTAQRETSALGISSVLAAGKKIVAAAIALGPFAWLIWRNYRSEPPDRRGVLIALGLAAAGALGLNVVLRLDGQHEYKFFMCAGMVLCAPALVAVQRRWAGSDASQRKLLAGLLAAMVVVLTVYSFRRLPHYASVEPKTVTDGFYLALAPDEPDAGWTDAVRGHTPPDTVVVVYKPAVHASSFCARSLWVPSEKDTQHCGYNMFGRQNMIEVRGYSAALFDHRMNVMERIFSSDVSRFGESLESLKKLNRPVAIAFGRDQPREFLSWLRDKQMGKTIYDDRSGCAVHLILPVRDVAN